MENEKETIDLQPTFSETAEQIRDGKKMLRDLRGRPYKVPTESAYWVKIPFHSVRKKEKPDPLFQ